MAEKKDPFRFTVMLNRTEPNHFRVTEILNQQGHRKAQFIVNAVLHYISCPETPAIQEYAPLDRQAIIAVVTQYLEEREQDAKAKPTREQIIPPRTSSPSAAPIHTGIQPESENIDNTVDMLSEESLAAIRFSLAAFEKK